MHIGACTEAKKKRKEEGATTKPHTRSEMSNIFFLHTAAQWCMHAAILDRDVTLQLSCHNLNFPPPLFNFERDTNIHRISI